MVKFRSDNAARLLVVAGLALLVGLITASTAWAFASSITGSE